MISVNQIRDRLASYVANEIPFEQFEDWLLGHSWNLHRDSSEAAQKLVHEIKSAIYEYLDGDIEEPDLKLLLSPHVGGKLPFEQQEVLKKLGVKF